MTSLVSGLVPIAGAIALGWGLRTSSLVADDLWFAISRLAYRALLPAALFSIIATTDYAGVPLGGFLAAMITAVLAMALAAFSLRAVLPMRPASFTSVFQGSIRLNGFVVLALAQATFSAQGTALVAVMFAVMVPLVNTLSVTVLAIYGGEEGHEVRVWPVLRGIAVNPLILSCILGLLAATTPVLRPGPLMDTAALVGRSALPLILLSVGAKLDFAALTVAPRLLVAATVMKLVLSPLAYLGLAAAFGVTGEARIALAAVGAAPGAASAYVLAKEMGGDAELMAGHVTATTILAFAALPFWIGIASG